MGKSTNNTLTKTKKTPAKKVYRHESVITPSSIPLPRMDDDLQEEENDIQFQKPITVDFDKRVRPFIDLIDRLRQYGLDQDVDLPAVAVIGDQSAGKSSTLEALSGIQLPRGSGIVTRCPLVLRLKSTPANDEWGARISYTDSSGEMHKRNIQTPQEVGEEIVLAQNMIAGDKKGISKELITLDVESCDVPDLTLIDLPGITRVAVDDQPQDIPEQIKKLIKERIEKQKTIILAVIPANVDIATTEALKLAKEYDPKGERTLGVVTKPDLIDRGTESELLAVLSNSRCELAKGYTVVKCRGQQKIQENQSLADALQEETEFFQSQPHFQDVEPSQLGIRNLSTKLSHELVEQIKQAVPELKQEVALKIEETKQHLSKLGRGLPTSKQEQALFLVEMLNSFGDRMKDICIGEYGNMEKKGEYRLFTHARECFKELMIAIANETPRDDDRIFIEKIIRESDENRGNELPRFMNYKVCQNLIREQIEKCRKHAESCVREVDRMVDRTLIGVAQDELAQFPGLCGEVKSTINKLRVSATECCNDRIQEILEMEKLVFTQDRIYNHDLDVVKEKHRVQEGPKLRNKHEQHEDDGILAQVGNAILQKLAFNHQITNSRYGEDMDQDVKKQEAKDMYHMIKAYLEVSARRIVDSIPLTIQLHLLKKLSENIRRNISAMVANPETMELVREEQSVVEQRENLQRKLDRLEKAENELVKV